MKYHITLILLIVTIFGTRKNLIAQSDFYAIDHIPEIRLYFAQSNWDELLDSLFIVGESARLGGDVVIDGILYEAIGVRYKGFSSYSSARAKNPFNIELDYVYSDQNHQGIQKIKLSNVIQDPSFVREVLSYEIARKYMPASKANYANVYVNDALIGLYSNIEEVGADFLTTYFGSNTNAFFKCNPETLDLNGENSNLSNALGTDISEYYPRYKLKSNDETDWNELYEFMDVLNESPADIDQLLNVDRALWMHAFNYAVINFDSYVGYAQNYYMYKGDDGRFNPILWDLNMSFASYRLSDASDHWDGFSVAEAKTIDPLQHYNSFSVQPRPLIRNLLNNDTYRRMYLAHLRTIMKENFENQEFVVRAQELQNTIDASVQADTNKFYSYTDFLDNLNSTVSDLVDYPGITDLMNDRATYLNTYPGIQGAPDISGVDVYPLNSTVGDAAWITAEVSGSPVNVLLAYRFARTETFTLIPMFDDGLNNDGSYNDGTFGAKIDQISNNLQYYIYAENDSSGRFSPERAAYEFYQRESKLTRNECMINELMTNNVFSVSDQNDEYEDWIELYNNSAYPISTDGLFLSNELNNLTKWEFPSKLIESGAYFTIWMDGDTSQTGIHANFELNGEGDTLWLSYADGTRVDSLVYGPQQSISSYGRYPNATGSFREMLPTFGEFNDRVDVSVLSNDVFVYPNPAGNEVAIRINQTAACKATIYSLDGRMVLPTQNIEGGGTLMVNTSSFSNGIYLLHASYAGKNNIQKIMITH